MFIRNLVYTYFFGFFLILNPCAFAGESESFTKDYIRHLETLEHSFDIIKLQEAAEAFKAYPTKEAHQALMKRLEHLPDQEDIKFKVSETDLVDIVSLFLVLAEDFCTRDDLPILKELNHWINLEMNSPELDEKILGVSLFLSQNTRGPVSRSLKGVAKKRSGDKLRSAHKASLNRVHKFRSFLEERVIGQEAILDSMQDLFLKDLVSGGHRSKPELFYFMGLPGNGKDTLAESFTDALWRTEGAHDKHMFRMSITKEAEAWSYFGSSKGYIGSFEIPAFLKFLVEHSGGRYIIIEEELPGGKDETRPVIAENPDWKPGETLSLSGPDKAVVFVNEAHNIPKGVKDTILKEAIEKGRFKINNPGTSPLAAHEMFIPVNFIFASNEGISLLEPRQKNGMRYGDPLSYERLIENFERVSEDKAELRQAVLKNNGEVNDPSGPNAPGTSEEWLNRFPDHRIHILRPLSPDSILKIAEIKSSKIGLKLSKARGGVGSYDVTVSKELMEYVTSLNYIPSENARPIEGRLESFIYDQIYKALYNQEIKPLGTKQIIEAGLIKNDDGSSSVEFKVTVQSSGETYTFNKLIQESLSEVPAKPIARDRIDEILAMESVINENVFGVEHITEQLITSALASESASKSSGGDSRPATVLAFLGKSSTGKTETAKQYAKIRHGESAKPTVIDFNGVRDLESLKAKVLGSYDSRGNPILSEFMKAYDRANGEIVFIFDEAANSPKELLKALYEILREPVAHGFSDGKPRPMKNVDIIITGNAGEQIYDAIPKHLPSDVYERALHEVFKIYMKDEGLRDKVLQQTFSQAFLARLGQNIFHFGPLTHKPKRQLTQLKLLQALKRLNPQPSERGWSVGFKSEKDLLNLIEMIEKDGFTHSAQGASIDKFIRESIEDKIRATLLRNGVRNGEKVYIEVNAKPVTRTEGNLSFKSKSLVIHDQEGRSFKIKVPLPQKNPSIDKNEVDRILTAYHEIGHEIVSEFYYGDRIRPLLLSIIPGVTLIGSELVHYAGIRSGEIEQETKFTKEAVLRDVAVNMAGYVAQQIVTFGARHDAGKQNDLHRSTKSIQDAILRYGLSEQWGKGSIPRGLSNSEYINTLPEHKKTLLVQITDQWLKEAERMAKIAIYANGPKLFKEMSKDLSMKGQMAKAEIEAHYEQNGLITERDGAEFETAKSEVESVLDLLELLFEKHGDSIDLTIPENLNFDFHQAEDVFNKLMKKESGFVGALLGRSKKWTDLSPLQHFVALSFIAGKVQDKSRDAKLSNFSWVPRYVANVDKLLMDDKTKTVEGIVQYDKFEIEKAVSWGSAMTCSSIL